MLIMMNNKNIFDLRQYLLFPQHENILFIPLLFAYLLHVFSSMYKMELQRRCSYAVKCYYLNIRVRRQLY
jgi:hypothetical protein